LNLRNVAGVLNPTKPGPKSNGKVLALLSESRAESRMAMTAL